MKTDIIIYNGMIHTIKSEDDIYKWMAIKDGKIIALGNEENYNHLIGDTTELIDLDKRTVIPGMYDCHVHLVQTGLIPKG